MFGVLHNHSFDLLLFPYLSSSSSSSTRESCTRKKTLENPPRTIHFRHVCCSAVLDKENPCSRIITPVLTDTEPMNQAAFTLDYLTNSCGLSLPKALSVSGKICITDTERPNSVISMLLEYGFNKAQVSQIIHKLPSVLHSDPEHVLRPKLEYFRGLGISDSDVGKLIARHPSILLMSLENNVVPTVNYLRSYVGTDENVMRVISRCRRVLRTNSVQIIEVNIAILRDHGVPDQNISKLLLTYPHTLRKKIDWFKSVVEKVKEMGFDPLLPMFCYAVRSMAQVTKEKWDKKILLFQSFGWSKDEVLDLFKRQPGIMTLSEEKLEKGLKFFMEELNWTREDMASGILLLNFNLEKTIIPRCKVLDILMSRGVAVKITSTLRVTEKRFMERYVNNYNESLPELMNIYNPHRVLKGKELNSGGLSLKTSKML